MPTTSSSPLRWFSRVVLVGILANVAMSLPTLLAPEAAIAFGRLPEATPLLWPRFAGLLLILLSAFYLPAVIDPIRYRLVAWLAVASRLVGVIFFLGFQPPVYHALGYFDLVFFVPELALLLASGRLTPGRSGALA